MPPAAGVVGGALGWTAAICARKAGNLTEIKCEIAVAKGKKLYNTREADKARAEMSRRAWV